MEVFKIIKGYNDYSIGCKGSVVSFKKKGRPGKEWDGNGGISIGRFLKPKKSKLKYPRYDLQGETVYAHILVLENFRLDRPKGMDARHIDGDPSNPDINNLEWGTKKENMADKKLHGTEKLGSKNHFSKLDECQVVSIKLLLKEGNKLHREIADRFEVSRSLIGQIARGDRWGWLKI